MKKAQFRFISRDFAYHPKYFSLSLIARVILMVHSFNITHSIEKKMNKVISIILHEPQLQKSSILPKAHALSVGIGKVHGCLVCLRSRHNLHQFILCTRSSGGAEGGINGQSNESTFSDPIVRSWLWSTPTRSCQLGYFSSITTSC